MSKVKSVYDKWAGERKIKTDNKEAKAPNSSLKSERTDKNKQARSVQDPDNSKEKKPKATERNEREACKALATAGEGLPGKTLDHGEKERKGEGESVPGGDVTEITSTQPPEFSVDSKNARGVTPLMWAARDGNFQAVKDLIKSGADPSLIDNNGWNSLHFAAASGDTGVISLVFAQKVEIESKTAEGYTPLMVAALSAKFHALEWFLKEKANVTGVTSVKCGRWNMLHAAAQGGDPEIIHLIHERSRLSIESKTDEGCTPLIVAALGGKLRAVKWFLEKRADVNVVTNNSWNMLHAAAQGGDPEIIHLIHERLPDSLESKTAEGYTPLFTAAFSGNLHAVKWFLEKEADVTCINYKGWNMLHAAAKGGDPEIIHLIQRHLPDSLESKSAEGYTPLFVAASNGKLHAVKWFLEKGATVTCESYIGWNMLHAAANSGDPDIIDLIHTRLRDIESKTAEGHTPLMIAVGDGKLEAVKYLLKRGADPLTKDYFGQDSRYHASSRHSSVLALLQSHLATSESNNRQ